MGSGLVSAVQVCRIFFENFYQTGYFERCEPSIVREVMPNALTKLQND
jgi:hypothetical protein